MQELSQLGHLFETVGPMSGKVVVKKLFNEYVRMNINEFNLTAR